MEDGLDGDEGKPVKRPLHQSRQEIMMPEPRQWQWGWDGGDRHGSFRKQNLGDLVTDSV